MEGGEWRVESGEWRLETGDWNNIRLDSTKMQNTAPAAHDAVVQHTLHCTSQKKQPFVRATEHLTDGNHSQLTNTFFVLLLFSTLVCACIAEFSSSATVSAISTGAAGVIRTLAEAAVAPLPIPHSPLPTLDSPLPTPHSPLNSGGWCFFYLVSPNACLPPASAPPHPPRLVLRTKPHPTRRRVARQAIRILTSTNCLTLYASRPRTR